MNAAPVGHRTGQEGWGPPSSPDLRSAALRAVMRHADWLDDHGPRSWDPYDLWATAGGRRAKAVYYRRPVLGVVAVAPFVFLDAVAPASRAILWHRQRFPTADAHYAMGFCVLAQMDRRRWLSRAWAFLDALVQERCPREAEYCWGYPFDWETCFGLWKAWTPFITTTPYAYEAFEAFHGLTGSMECLTIMESIGRFAADRIRGVEVAPGVKASTYSPFDLRRVVNASAYRGFILAAAGVRFERPEWIGEARAALAFVLRSQREDGSWLYAEDGKDAFVDNMHTCFVIKNLVKSQRFLADGAIASAIDRGWSFFKDNLLDRDGLPVPYTLEQRPRLYRRDLYDYAETINLAQLLAAFDSDAAAIADRAVTDLLERWTLPDGHFVTREMLIGRNTVPYVRWAQSQVFRALSLYALQDVT